jgi:hypothetical protein
MEGKEYLMGLDLGFNQDFSVLSILERTLIWLPEENRRARKYTVTFIKRWPLQSGYPSIIREVKAIMDNPKFLPNPELVVDIGGPGMPVYQMMREYDLSPRGINITSGANARQDENGFYLVPRREILSMLLLGLQSGLVGIDEMPLTQDLVRELEGLKLKLKERTGRESIESGDHDDIALSVGIAYWYGATFGSPTEMAMDQSGNETLSDYNPLGE